MDLRRYCRLEDIKLTEMATKLGISHSHLSNIMYNRHRPSPSLVKRIHKATEGHVTEQDLMSSHKCPKCHCIFCD